MSQKVKISGLAPNAIERSVLPSQCPICGLAMEIARISGDGCYTVQMGVPVRIKPLYHITQLCDRCRTEMTVHLYEAQTEEQDG